MTRHELKTQDEITTTLQSFTEVAYTYKTQILIGVGAVVLLIAAFSGWRMYSSKRNADSQALLAGAISAYNDESKPEKERYEKTIAEATKTANAYPSLPAGAVAKYYMGMSQEGLGDTANAVKTLQEVVDRGDSNIKPVAQFALAGIYKRHGEFQKAAEVLKQLYDSGAYSKPVVAFELAKTYESNKQPDQAKTYYSQLITDFGDPQFKQQAEAGLKRMGFHLPAPNPAA